MAPCLPLASETQKGSTLKGETLLGHVFFPVSVDSH